MSCFGHMCLIFSLLLSARARCIHLPPLPPSFSSRTPCPCTQARGRRYPSSIKRSKCYISRLTLLLVPSSWETSLASSRLPLRCSRHKRPLQAGAWEAILCALSRDPPRTGAHSKIHRSNLTSTVLGTPGNGYYVVDEA